MALYLGNLKIAGNGGESGGSEVQVNTIQKTGTNIANISVDNTEYKLYSPPSITDIKINGVSKGSTGNIDLGTVLTSLNGAVLTSNTDQSISGKKIFNTISASTNPSSTYNIQNTDNLIMNLNGGTKSYNVTFSKLKNSVQPDLTNYVTFDKFPMYSGGALITTNLIHARTETSIPIKSQPKVIYTATENCIFTISFRTSDLNYNTDKEICIYVNDSQSGFIYDTGISQNP